MDTDDRSLVNGLVDRKIFEKQHHMTRFRSEEDL